MADETFLDTLEDDITERDRESAKEKALQLASEGGDFHPNQMLSEEYRDRLGEDADRHLAARTDARKRRGVGLEGDRAFEFAERLYGIGEGDIKTQGQIESEKELAILAQAQRGRALGYGGFDAAAVLQRAGSSAQQTALTGESAISKSARQAQQAAKDQLEQLLISGEQRAENKAFAMQQLAFQQDQASGSLWSNVLGGVLGAVGAVVGGFTGGPAGALAGGKAGGALGSGAGKYLG
tara:strand:- start:963 stop:1676 length:714 start_codon:yes stop_codon:yes gene_type:complete